jgi:DNA helicase-2/ATP-dependent DNA helicase PcrA
LAIEEAFSRHKIPYRIESESNFYNRYEVNMVLNYLRLVYQPDSFEADSALKTVINVPNRYVGHGFIKALESFAQQNGLHLYPALKRMPVKASYLKHEVDEFIDLIDEMIRSGHLMEPVDFIHHIRESLDIDKYLADETGDPFEESSENLDQLQMTAGSYAHLGDFLDHTEFVGNHSAHDENGVTLSTIHKAKGLEFAVVFVIGMIEGMMPNANGDIEEERRIAFVAMSRAMKRLYLSYSMNYLGKPAQRSSFISEALKE